MPQQRFMSNRKMLLGEDSNALVFLFAVNMTIFVLISFLKTVYYLTDTPLELFQDAKYPLVQMRSRKF